MPATVQRKLEPVSWKHVAFAKGFWGDRVETNRTATLPIEHEQCRRTGRLDAFGLDWKPGEEGQPHHFWDSDVAKWIEAAAYSLATHPDAELEKRVDAVVDRIARAQQPDGYLNVYFTVVKPGERWTNLRDMHELYCAGHLMEAAVALFEGTGKRALLEVMCRYADHIDAVFGPEAGKKRGYPGHEEIELALVKLYRATGERRYLRLAAFFVNERGRQPHYFEEEARARGEDCPDAWSRRFPNRPPHDYTQAHRPVREQETAEGHAVRAAYLYAGMADVAAETGDAELLGACRTLWKNVTERRMYVTGGIGSSHHGERFTFDYDLPNEEAYAETCAAIALVFWAHRMLQIEADGEYADVMERALYNGVASGISLDGTRFFYVNPLSQHPAKRDSMGHWVTERQAWFGCACCPPNIARLYASLGQYVYSTGPKALYVHLYAAGEATLNVGGGAVAVRQETEYPWDETVRLVLQPDAPRRFTLALRIPGWCRKASARVNGKAVDLDTVRKGYARLERDWAAGDTVELTLAMPVERIEAHPAVVDDCGRVALQRGPLVYCLEEEENGDALADVIVPRGAGFRTVRKRTLLGDVVLVSGNGARRVAGAWKGRLYRPGPTKEKSITLRAVPYCVWANRSVGEMRVWLRDGV